MRALINDPDHWRQRAQEARAIAEQLADAAAKGTMLKIADGYEHLAERAEARALLAKGEPAVG